MLGGQPRDATSYPANCEVAVACRIAANQSLPSGWAIVARAAENMKLKETVFVVASARKYVDHAGVILASAPNVSATGVVSQYFRFKREETNLKKTRNKKLCVSSDMGTKLALRTTTSACPIHPPDLNQSANDSKPRCKAAIRKPRMKKECGSTDTATKRPCRITIYPCTLHTPNGKRRPKSLTTLRRKLAEKIPYSKSIAQAARESGYSKSVSQSRIYQIVQSAEVQQAIINNREVTLLQPIAPTQELDPPIDAKVVDQARTDFYAEVDDLLCSAKDDGMAVTREEVIEKLKPVYEHVLGAAVVDAMLNDNTINKISANFDDAVEDFLQIVKKIGINVTREHVVRRLEPFLRDLPR